MRLSLILGLSLFGRGYKNVKAVEIIQRTKVGVVLHIATQKRMVEIPTMNYICECNQEAKGINYTCGGKVSIEKHGMESSGHIMEERDDGLFYLVTSNR